MDVQSVPFIGGFLAITLLVIALAARLIGQRRRFASLVVATGALVVSTLLATTTMALVVNVGGSWVKTTDDVIGLIKNAVGKDDESVVNVLPQQSDQSPDAQSEQSGTQSGGNSAEAGDTDLLPASVAPDLAYKTDFHSDPETGELTAMVVGNESGLTRSVTIWVPKDYDPASSTVYDVMVFNHGYPGTDKGPANGLQIQQTYDDLVAQGQARPMIFVTPDVSMEGAEPNCVDIEGHPKVETFITTDVVRALRSSFPNLNPYREGWILSGISAGGYCAPVLAMRHNDVFFGAISMGGNDAPEFGPLADAGEPTISRFTISHMLTEVTGPAIHMYFAGTKEESTSLALVTDVAGKGRPDDEITTQLDPTGGHSWTVWSSQLAQAMPWWVTTANAAQSARDQAAAIERADADAKAKAEADRRAAEQAARAAAEAAENAVKHPPLFSLRGWGTIGACWATALTLVALSLWGGPRLRPRSGYTGQHIEPGTSRAGAPGPFAIRYLLAFASTLALSIGVLLLVNRDQNFYTTLSGLLSDLAIFF